jgi:hypothetical protein
MFQKPQRTSRVFKRFYKKNSVEWKPNTQTQSTAEFWRKHREQRNSLGVD